MGPSARQSKAVGTFARAHWGDGVGGVYRRLHTDLSCGCLDLRSIILVAPFPVAAMRVHKTLQNRHKPRSSRELRKRKFGLVQMVIY